MTCIVWCSERLCLGYIFLSIIDVALQITSQLHLYFRSETRSAVQLKNYFMNTRQHKHGAWIMRHCLRLLIWPHRIKKYFSIYLRSGCGKDRPLVPNSSYKIINSPPTSIPQIDVRLLMPSQLFGSPLLCGTVVFCYLVTTSRGAVFVVCYLVSRHICCVSFDGGLFLWQPGVRLRPSVVPSSLLPRWGDLLVVRVFVLAVLMPFLVF